jgi:beta-ribofuranosylaminobenzene 5'-phosphate synthase
MTTAVYVRAPCRLHFGMFSFGRAATAQFGGVGVMIEPPSVEVRISPANAFTTKGPKTQRQRADSVVRRAVIEWTLNSLPACEVDVYAPPDHIGLGVGTQLSLAIVAGLRRFLNLCDLPAGELAKVTGRGMRSAIGTHGFERGGLIVDAGKQSTDELGKLAVRTDLPEAWRFVLIRPVCEYGLSGLGESSAFERLPAVPEEVTRTLWDITANQMLPAVAAHDCEAFGEAVFEFGRKSGESFAAVQGGPFASEHVARLVNSIREFGVRGVGQSSWGPTVFAVTASEEEARRLADSIRTKYGASKCEFAVARPNNSGAHIERIQKAAGG